MFGNVAMGVRKETFEAILTDIKSKKGLKSDQEFSISDLQQIIASFKEIAMPPDDPHEQLKMAIRAVFNSWYTPRAIAYREINGIKHTLGTAICVQSMVYGNMNNKSGSGVLFTRDPVTGLNTPYGEYLTMCEGEDVVSGSHTPMKLDDLKRDSPSIHNELIKTANVLEKHYRDMQDIEFTVESNKFYILQTRRGKRTPPADVKIAVSMVKEGLINQREAINRISANQMDFFLHPMIDPTIKQTGLPGIQSLIIGKGLAASPGAAVGAICFNNNDAKELSQKGQSVILVRVQTSADDVIGLHAAAGVLTMRGGMTRYNIKQQHHHQTSSSSSSSHYTSHAAVVARGIAKPGTYHNQSHYRHHYQYVYHTYTTSLFYSCCRMWGLFSC